MIRILVLSRTPWARDNSFGNTFDNLFSGLPDIEIGNIYCRYGRAESDLVSRAFQITERDLIENILHSDVLPGHEILHGKPEIPNRAAAQRSEELRYNFGRRHRLSVLFLARELIWKFGKWNSTPFLSFLDNFSPDLLYLPLYPTPYMLNIARFIQEYTGARAIGHMSDDDYSLKQLSFSPYFWINRFIVRSKIRKITKNCAFLHVITYAQKEEYERTLRIECRVFKKAMDFSGRERQVHELHNPMRLVYAGGIAGGRWRTLSVIGDALDKINAEKLRAKLYICSNTPMTRSMKKALLGKSSIEFCGNVSAENYQEMQNDADILVLVESERLSERSRCRLSLSTKIVDYLYTGNCILAVGTQDLAEVRYLQDGDAAIVVNRARNIEPKLRELLDNPDQIKSYGGKAWNFAKTYHNQAEVKKAFYRDLCDALKR